MFDDPQLDVDEAPKGAQYKVDDMVLTVDGELVVVVDIEFIGSVYNGNDYDRDDPKNYDYLLMNKECEEFWYMDALIEHKANHMKEVYNG